MNQQEIYDKRNDFYLIPSDKVKKITMILIGLGVIGTIAAFTQVDAKRVWGSLLFSFFFLYSISLGGVAFGAMQDLIGSAWGRPIKKLHEGFGAFLPICTGFFIIFLVCIQFHIAGAHTVYSWIENPGVVAGFPGKNIWLQQEFMVVRDIAALLITLYFTSWHMGLIKKRDRQFIDHGVDSAQEIGLQTKQKLRHWSAPILVIYALCYSLLGFDLLMSLNPLWFSTLWGGYNFAIMMQTLMALIMICLFLFKSSGVGSMYGRQQFHDIGKMMHGFTVFFAYLTFAHVLTYWYGNVPEETEYFLHRLHQPWLTLVLIIPFTSFVIPLYSLIPKASKWTKSIAMPLASMILVSQWFLILLFVMPEVSHSGVFWVESLAMALASGLFLWSFFNYAQKNVMVGVGDPILPEAYDHH